MRIAAVQLDIRWENREVNHSRIRKLIERADLPAGSLIVLPEMFDVGFSMNTVVTDPGSPSVSEAFCRKLANETKSAVMASMAARTGDGRLANEAIAFSPDGEELVRYRKMQPFSPPGEHLAYIPGAGHKLFTWQGTKIAPFICYDLRFPEVFRPAARDGAEVIIVVANWPAIRSEHWVRLLQARSIENLAYVVGVNRCGADPKIIYDGRSCGFDPHGKQIFEANGQEQVIVIDVDAAESRNWRDKFPALKDMRHIK